MTRSATPPVADAVLAGRIAELLADLGDAGLTEALELLVAELDLRSAVLRDADGPGLGRPRAAAGDAAAVVPAMRVVSADSTVELGVRSQGRDVGVLVVIGARPSQLPTLRATASVLGLALSRAGRPPAGDPVADLVAAADADADAAADLLHDGPVQALVVAHYAAEAAARGGDAVAAREAVQAALVELRRSLWHLRPRSHHGLSGALQQLSARLEEAGRPPLGFVLDEVLAAGLGSAVVSTAYRLVQSVAVPLADDPVLVTLRREGGSVVLEIEGGTPLGDMDRWIVRARALGGSVSASGARIRLAVPLPTNRLPTNRSKATS